MMIFVLLLAASQLQFGSCARFDGNYLEFDAAGTRYLAVWDDHVTQAEAAPVCEAVGATLVDLDTDEKVNAIGDVLYNMGGNGDDGYYEWWNLVRYWVAGKTNAPVDYTPLTGDNLANDPDGEFCKFATNNRGSDNPSKTFAVQSRPCDQIKEILCERGQSCFGDKTTPFKVGDKHYVAGWDEKVTQGGAEEKCASIGATLANLNTDATKDAVLEAMRMLNPTGASSYESFWINGKTSSAHGTHLKGDDNLTDDPNGASPICSGSQPLTCE